LFRECTIIEAASVQGNFVGRVVRWLLECVRAQCLTDVISSKQKLLSWKYFRQPRNFRTAGLYYVPEFDNIR
jgi:hypothetical protein